MSGNVRQGTVAAFAVDNVDTDVIIPMEPLLSVPRSELGKHAFEALRYRPDGTANPEFALNATRFAGASILVGGRNFGCGSSREGAVHALAEMGFDVVVASSFGDIFLANCVKNSMVPALVSADDLARLHALLAGSDQPVVGRLDLDTMQLTIGELTVTAHLDRALRDQLDGGDEVVRTLAHAARIEAFQLADRARRPWIWANA